MANECGHMCDMPVCEQSLMETSDTEAVYFSSLKKPCTSLHSTDTGGRRNPSSEAPPPQQTSFAPVIITRYNIKLQALMLLSTLTALQGGLPFLPRLLPPVLQLRGGHESQQTGSFFNTAIPL